ncbi:uncharacterized protein LOC115677194 [Syzygium oleosum]|uniref:uncharacterized protein LOC115677194 n=1 Tax=Syzygium oleosum TaxID=219896 RepID=UPI0011D1837E|nr:uncharacterized protein LOC115677194 [Syzygium oleosum]
MAQSFDDADFWLPSKHLPRHDHPCGMGRGKLGPGANAAVLAVDRRGPEPGVDGELAWCLSNFPSEFPYEIDSPVESVLSSTETESSDEEDPWAGLARALTQSPFYEPPAQKLPVPGFARHKPEKLWVMAGSPKSTLSGIGSWSSRSLFSANESPKNVSQIPSPTTPFGAESETWDLVYAAAMEVARLKMTCQEAKYSAHQQNGGLVSGRITNPGLHSSHHRVAHVLTQPTQHPQHAREDRVLKRQASLPVWARTMEGWSENQQQQQLQLQIQSRVKNAGLVNGRCGRNQGYLQSAWTPLHNGPGVRAPPFVAGSGSKRECAGTGVFLPRRYGDLPESRKKSGGSTTVVVPPKVVQALQLNVDDMSGQAQPFSNDAFAPDHAALMARRAALLSKQRSLNHEIRLPQEWTY